MRIISGKHKGRKIKVIDNDHLRPTSGRIKESIFNILTHGKFYQESPLKETCIADLCCGTGAMGLEALSRGAAHAIFLDKDPNHLAVVKENIAHLSEEGASSVIRADISNPPKAKRACSLLFLDPPYHSEMLEKTLRGLKQNGWLEEQAIIVLEMHKREQFNVNEEHFECTEDRTYGTTRIVILEAKK